MPTDLDSKNRNLPNQGGSARPGGPNDGTPLSPAESAAWDQLSAEARATQESAELLEGLQAASSGGVEDGQDLENGDDFNQVESFTRDNLGIGPASDKNGSGSSSSGKHRPSVGRQTKNESEARTNKDNSGSKSSSEAATLGSLIKDERQQKIDAVRNRAQEAESTKVGRFSLRGKAKKKLKVFLLGSLVTIMLAVPIGVIGAIPHAIQTWIGNRVGEYTERAMDKIGQKALTSFIKNRVAVDECRRKYNAAANVEGVTACRPRVEQREGSRLSQLFNDWHAANMEESLVNHGINVEYDYRAGQRGEKPYRITIAREGSDNKNFDIVSSADNPSDLNFIDLSEATGKRESSLILKKEMKAVLKEDTKWWQYLKRRNLKAGYLRDLGLPSRVFPSKKIAKKLDDFDLAKANLKNKSSTKFRQHLTKWVVSKGDGRMGLFLELLISGDDSKGKPSALRESNETLAAAANKLGVDKVDALIEKYGGRNLQEIELELFKSLLTRLFGQIGQNAGQFLADTIPVVGQILLAMTILDIIDMSTDGTLQRFINSMNVGAMRDIANLMDTTISEEKRGYVDAASAGDMRLRLINGLGSSRIFTNLVGYKSPSGTKAAGYNCKPDVSIQNISSVFDAAGQILNSGDPTAGAQLGMSDNQDVCENHRVDYDPLSALGDPSELTQGALKDYTETPLCNFIIPGGQYLPDISIPGVGKCPPIQKVYHSGKDGIGWVAGKLGFLTDWFAKLPPVKWLIGNVAGWLTNAITIMFTGQSLVGPQILQGGLTGESKSGARIVDGWYGGGAANQSSFAKGVGDGGGLGAVPLTATQAASLNQSIAQDRKEELASSSVFERMFDISNADTAISGVVGAALVDGGIENLVNPMTNIAMAFKSTSGSAFADDGSQQHCVHTNKNGHAVDEFGTICYGYTDDMINNLSDEDLDKYSDPEFCKTYTKDLDAKRKEAEESTDTSRKDPDGTGTSTEPDYCRALCTVTDTMGTAFRSNDTICGFDSEGGSSSSSSGESLRRSPGAVTADKVVKDALGKCEGVEVSRPAAGTPLDVEVQTVPGTGMQVRSDICTNAKNMIEAAAADPNGVDLDGGAWRSSAVQIDLRRQHCGSSEYAIYEMDAGSCHPPTARPGSSNHEIGLAIDFSNCSYRSTSCYRWLSQHAAQYGFFNLPSEPWHWSVDGK